MPYIRMQSGNGTPAGGVIYRALRHAKAAAPDSTTVVLVCDGGEKYLNTVFDDEWMNTHRLADVSITEELASLLPRATTRGSSWPSRHSQADWGASQAA